MYAMPCLQKLYRVLDRGDQDPVLEAVVAPKTLRPFGYYPDYIKSGGNHAYRALEDVAVAAISFVEAFSDR